MAKRVVVTGLGVISSIGIGKENFWQSLIKGVCGVKKVGSFDTSGHTAHLGAEAANFNPVDFINKKKIKYLGRASQMAIASTKLALEDAGLEIKALKDLRAAVSFGTTMGEIQSFEKADQEWIRNGKEAIDVLDIYKYPSHNIPSNVAIEFGLKARNRLFTTACAAGNYAIGYGFDLLRCGRADLAVTGGADVFSWIAFTGFDKIGAIAPQECSPFDKNRKGTIPADGSAALILETLDRALERKADIYAEILGYGLSCDAYHMTSPSVEGIAECMRQALKDANIKDSAVDYISAHGTGTIYNDRAESVAINEVFGKRRISVSSIKSMLGHTMGVASALEAISCCLTIKQDIIPPTINYKTPDPECDIDCVANVARKQKVNIALNNAFGFGGNNSCLVIKKYAS
ncbi:MAG: beta-ketoacyl-[acyl-carrier-protein] synthase family protein [Candidatus Omnitrophota bacterium]